MNFNNKGATLTELLVSIVMLSVAIIMMYGLLSNLQKKKNDVDIKSENMIKIADIEKYFQELVMEPCDYGREAVISPTVILLSSKKNVGIQYNKDGTKSFIINISNNIITLKEGTTIKRSWTMKESCQFLYDDSKSYNQAFGDNPYNIIIQCGSGNTADYIKFPMYFRVL